MQPLNYKVNGKTTMLHRFLHLDCKNVYEMDFKTMEPYERTFYWTFKCFTVIFCVDGHLEEKTKLITIKGKIYLNEVMGAGFKWQNAIFFCFADEIKFNLGLSF